MSSSAGAAEPGIGARPWLLMVACISLFTLLWIYEWGYGNLRAVLLLLLAGTVLLMSPARAGYGNMEGRTGRVLRRSARGLCLALLAANVVLGVSSVVYTVRSGY